jgi:lysine biosynthesis protein LysW
MKLFCPECKNNINIEDPAEIEEGSILECDTCGVTLEVTSINGDHIDLEVIDEGK